MHRFIPACAGNTPMEASAASTAAVHPRVCGEHIAAPLTWAPLIGSSPRVRGTPGAAQGRRRVWRFIPACAGNTRNFPAGQVPAPVHPRVCGEHKRDLCAAGQYAGSSPRVRGTQPHEMKRMEVMRFIPACAGNTAFDLWKPAPLTVHPRVCGEHMPPEVGMDLNDGSSPRVRGTRGKAGNKKARNRFIPACAGNTTHRPPGQCR